MSRIEKMNVYLSNLALINPRLHNLHWNVTGLNFVAIHEFTEEIYNELFTSYDDVAEQIKILGGAPLVKLSEYLEKATITEIPSGSFSETEVLEIVKKDLEALNAMAMDLRAASDSEGDTASTAMFEDHIASFEKRLWFIRAMLGQG